MSQTLSHVAGVLPGFTLACLVLAMLPGPATALFLHRAVRDGRPAGLAAVAGNEIGVFGWALAAGAGLTALLQASHLLYEAMHIAGGAVLAYLGISAWRKAGRDDLGGFGAGAAGRLPDRTPLGAFRASLVTVAANPKAAVFAFSFFPQFLPRHGPVLAVTAVLGGIQVVIDGSYCAAVVVLASRAGRWLSRAAIRRRLERALGAVLLGLGLELAAETR